MREHLKLPPGLDGRVWKYSNTGANNLWHRHAELELNLVTRGTATYLLANRQYTIHRGDLVWLFPAQEHVLIDLSPDFEMWVAVFRRKAIRRLSTDRAVPLLLAKNRSDDCCRRLALTEHRRMDEAIRELASSETRPALLNAGLSYLLLRAWQVFEGAAEIPVRDVHPAVERVVRLIREDAADLPLGALADRAGLSPARLSRLFREQTGVAMVTFRNRERIGRFLTLYGTGQRRTMLDAALESGFGSYAQFHRVFRNVLGCSPAEYKANHG